MPETHEQQAKSNAVNHDGNCERRWGRARRRLLRKEWNDIGRLHEPLQPLLPEGTSQV